MKNYLKKFKGAASLLLMLFVVFGLTPIQNVFAQARADEVSVTLIAPDTSSKDRIFVVAGESIHFTVQSTADEVTYHVPTPSNPLTVSMVETSPDIFEADWTPQESDRYDPVVDLNSYSSFKHITFTAYSSGVSSGSCSLKYAVLLGDRSFYTGRFKSSTSLSWTSPTNNRFLYGYSNEYNCKGFVDGTFVNAGLNTYNGYPKIENDDPRWHTYPRTIQYETMVNGQGNGYGAHIVKVVSWFQDGEYKGMPRTIQSKETAFEVIEIPAYITVNGKPDFDIYNNCSPVSISSTSGHSIVYPWQSIGSSGHSISCSCGDVFTEPHTLVQHQNSFGHYQTCAKDCGYQTDILPHTGSWVYYDNTQHKRVCTFAPCGYVSYAVHDDAAWTNYGDSAQHRKYCSTCGGYVYENHSWGPWDNTGVTGGHYRTCTVCGYRSDTVPHTLRTISNSSTHYQRCDLCGYESTPMAHIGPWDYYSTAQHKRVCTFSGCGYVSYADHAYGAWTDYGNSTQHRKSCSACGNYVYENHSWGPWDYSGVTGGHYRTCTVCGYRSDTVPHTLRTISSSSTHYQRCDLCGYESTPMSHTGPWDYYSTAQHRRVCTFSGCGYVSYADHAYGSWTNYSNSTQHRKYCSTCGDYQYQDHTWGPWDYTGSGGHFRTCTVCGYRSDTVSHSLYTISTSSTHYQRCDACGYTTTPLSHTFGSWTYYSSTQHKHTCTFSGCGYTAYASHSYGSWTNYGSSTQHRKYCSTCGDYVYENHSWGAWDYTGSGGHFRTCTVCGYRSDTVSHSLTTISSSSTHYQRCGTCGYTTTPMSHTFGSWVYYSSAEHKHSCTFSGCGYTTYGSHGGSWANYSSTQHRKYCSTCGSYIYASHAWGSWTNYGNSTQHRRYCSTCGGYSYANHSWQYVGSTKRCTVCYYE